MYDEKNDGKRRIRFNLYCDDPYMVLARHIVIDFSNKAVRSALRNDQFIRSLVVSEAKQLDICGYFLDCIDEEIIKQERVRHKNKYLKKLGEYYYSELDLPRLRENIRKFAGELGISLDD